MTSEELEMHESLSKPFRMVGDTTTSSGSAYATASYYQHGGREIEDRNVWEGTCGYQRKSLPVECFEIKPIDIIDLLIWLRNCRVHLASPFKDLFLSNAAVEPIQINSQIGSSYSTESEHELPETPAVRGVFYLSYSGAKIFSQNVRFNVSELPQWKPRISLDERTLRMINE